MPARSDVERWTTRLAAALLTGVVLRMLWFVAWQGDDAYITHRTATNVLTGHGLTWNPAERVQAFTHPLWLGVSVLGHLLTGEAYYSVLALSAVLVGISGVLLVRAAPQAATGLAVAALASASAAVVDWGVSGLENPLMYVILLLFVPLCGPTWDRSVGRLARLLLGMLALTRPDAPLIVLPLCLLKAWDQPRVLVPALVTGLLPLLAWEGFSLVYYGSLVPNTAWAKLNVDIPALELATQGLRYLADSAHRDPLTVVMPLMAAILVLTRGQRGDRALMLGLGLYLVYVVRIGGDFMALRFVAAPTVLAAGLVARHAPDLPRLPLLIGVVAVGLVSPGSRWLAQGVYGEGVDPAEIVGNHGIADERAWYSPETGLASVAPQHAALVAAGVPIPPNVGARAGAADREAGRPFAARQDVGYYAYFGGPGIHVVDLWALADPFLARIPYRPSAGWRVGHYPRTVPPAYFRSVASGEASFETDALNRAYADVHAVVSGPLFSMDRAGAIWRLHTGAHRDAFENLASGEDASPAL